MNALTKRSLSSCDIVWRCAILKVLQRTTNSQECLKAMLYETIFIEFPMQMKYITRNLIGSFAGCATLSYEYICVHNNLIEITLFSNWTFLLFKRKRLLCSWMFFVFLLNLHLWLMAFSFNHDRANCWYWISFYAYWLAHDVLLRFRLVFPKIFNSLNDILFLFNEGQMVYLISLRHLIFLAWRASKMRFQITEITMTKTWKYALLW